MFSINQSILYMMINVICVCVCFANLKLKFLFFFHLIDSFVPFIIIYNIYSCVRVWFFFRVHFFFNFVLGKFFFINIYLIYINKLNCKNDADDHINMNIYNNYAYYQNILHFFQSNLQKNVNDDDNKIIN